jgi:hypothetical protein
MQLIIGAETQRPVLLPARAFASAARAAQSSVILSRDAALRPVEQAAESLLHARHVLWESRSRHRHAGPYGRGLRFTSDRACAPRAIPLRG